MTVVADGPAAGFVPRAGAWLVEVLRRRLIPLFPCAIGLGIAVYFALPREPGATIVALVAAVAAGLALASVLFAAVRPVLLLLFAIVSGFMAAQFRTALVNAPAVAEDDLRGGIEGRIIEVETLPRGVRILLDEVLLDRLAPDVPQPGRIRLRVAVPPPQGFAPGDRIRTFGIVGPPSAPLLPGGFDFRRHAFFEGLGGVGVTFGTPAITGRDDPGWQFADPLRRTIADRVRASLDGDTAALAVAFLTGERAGISEEANVAMRDSGLAHLLSISGVHVNLVALIVFFTVRFGLAAIAPVALRHPIKKWAACAALAAILCYMIVVGGSVPTLRATLMTGIVLLAVMLDRVAFSIRLIALAATVVLLTTPDAMLGPSFQMSFAAVLALIAGYEALRRHGWLARVGRPGLVRRLGWYALGVVLTTVIATAATAPFAIYHFQRFSLVATVANLLAMPLTSLAIMPSVLLAYPMMALDLDLVALLPLGWSMDGMLAIARWTASLPESAVSIPAMPAWGLAAAVAGGLWLCLGEGKARLLGILGLMLAAFSVVQLRPPDILVSADGRLAAVRAPDGSWSFSTRRAERFAREQWLRHLAGVEAERWPETGVALDGGLRCDPSGCLFEHEGGLVAFPRRFEAAAEDCLVADLVIYPYRAPGACAAETLLIDGAALRQTGALAITLGEEITIRSVREEVGERPWTPWR